MEMLEKQIERTVDLLREHIKILETRREVGMERMKKRPDWKVSDTKLVLKKWQDICAINDPLAWPTVPPEAITILTLKLFDSEKCGQTGTTFKKMLASLVDQQFIAHLITDINRVYAHLVNLHFFRSFCTMCDIEVIGSMAHHRRALHHQQLKDYLHPKCAICQTEHTNRMDWYQHCLSESHLKKLHEKGIETNELTVNIIHNMCVPSVIH